jgi:hypothetical protein
MRLSCVEALYIYITSKLVCDENFVPVNTESRKRKTVTLTHINKPL